MITTAPDAPRTIAALRDFLAAAGPGQVAELPGLTAVLAQAWPDLAGSGDAGMASWKIARIEAAAWAPPVLTFVIERHGATVLGSTRAEVQHWAVNLDDLTADVVTGRGSYRQVRGAAPRLDVGPLVAEVMALIDAGEDDPRLKWSPDRTRVRVASSRVIPSSGPRQTVEGRLRRFRAALAAAMTNSGRSPIPGPPPGWWQARPDMPDGEDAVNRDG